MRDYRSEVLAGVGRSLASVPEDSLTALIEAVGSAGRVFVTGAGRSLLFVKSLAMALMQIGRSVYATGEVATPAIGPGDLLVVATSSGTTKSVLLFVEQARDQGEYFRQGLLALQREFPLIREVRGEGVLLTLELDLRGMPAFVERSFGYLLWGRLLRDREGGVAAAVCPIYNNCLRYLPPLDIDRDAIDRKSVV